MYKVAILAYRNVALFELACAAELFALPRPEFSNWYQAEVVALDTGPQPTIGGLQLIARTVDTLADFDMLVIPSWVVNAKRVRGKLAAEIQAFHRQRKRIISFCSGAFLLASCDVLDGRQATTHWRYAEKFRARFPNIEYVDNVLYLYDGQIGCSAGSAAAIDLGLEVIRHDFGHAVSREVARRLVVSAHRKGGQSQFVQNHQAYANDQLGNAVEWALQNLAQPFSIDHLAGKAAMSRRNFDRKFRQTFNQTPKAWLTGQRLDLARQMLEQNLTSIEQIAAAAGFENATTLRHHFRKQLGVSPRQYRDQFAA